MHGQTLIVIGGGAAGFFCAVNAARLHPGLRVILLEKTGKLLSKVKVSGGGRCNVTHACFDIGEMSQRYPRGTHFVKKAFHRFFTNDTVEWFESRGVKIVAEADGRMFPASNDSQTIIDCLLKEASLYNVDLRLHADVKKMSAGVNGFELTLGNGTVLHADRLCIACGGYPKAEMFQWIRSSGHTIKEPVPSLFTFNLPGESITKLMGISTDVQLQIKDSKLKSEGPLLITHWGLSGPAVLKLSAWGARDLAAMNWHFTVRVNWLPGQHPQSLSETFMQMRSTHGSQSLRGHRFGLPARLWEFLLQKTGVDPQKNWAELTAKERTVLSQQITSMELAVKGKTTFKEEFVTAGGISLSEVDPATMMSKKIPGLYFAGEILDVDGITGGYNFQHAWTSGFIAAQMLDRSN
jgi:predicted Rossmann fold flavoprotein